MLQKLRAPLDERASLEGQPSNLFKCAHFWALVWRSFTRNRCPARASALAYGTLLALIPVLAVVVSVTSTFLKKEGEDRIDQFIEKMVSTVMRPGTLVTNVADNVSPMSATNATPGAAAAGGASPGPGVEGLDGGQTNRAALGAYAQTDEAIKARQAVARQIHQFIQNTRSRTLGVTGTVLLIFAAISMLSQVEDTFNDIWGAVRGRTWFTRAMLYWGVLTLAPLLIVLALGLTTGPHLQWTRDLLTRTPLLSKVIFQGLRIVLLCLGFAVFYMLIPNTKVEWHAALAGGVAGGILFHLNNSVSALYVSRVVSNSRIYGSLGLIPVLMIGLYFVWWILLFGAQVAYAVQNRTAYLEEKQVEAVNQRGREFIALRLMTCIGQHFGRGAAPPSVAEMSAELGVPSRLVQQILQTLCAARLVAETAGPETAYLPARPLASINCHDILLSLRAGQGQELATRDEPARREVYGEFSRIEEAERQAAAGVTVQSLVDRAQGPKELPGGEVLTN
jgi:membrane protein